MALRETPFGPEKLARYEIHIPPNHPRGRHPQDAQHRYLTKSVWSLSSQGHHMQLSGGAYVNDLGEAQFASSQWGSQFDTPFHFDPEGAEDIDRKAVSGPAMMIDLRKQLARDSDGEAITVDVVRAWLTQAIEKRVLREPDANGFGSPCATRILIRTLSDAQALSETPLATFPYFANGEAVDLLMDGIRAQTGVTPRVVFVEPPSVDRVDQGCLLHEDVVDGLKMGGAHGALHRRGMIIGENFDLHTINNTQLMEMLCDGNEGLVQVYFGPQSFPDAVPVVGAHFIPKGVLGRMREAVMPDIKEVRVR